MVICIRIKSFSLLTIFKRWRLLNESKSSEQKAGFLMYNVAIKFCEDIMSYFVGIALQNDKAPQHFHIAYEGLKRIGVDPDKLGISEGKYLTNAMDRDDYTPEAREKIRRHFAEMHLRAEFGPPMYYNENWHDDQLKLQQSGKRTLESALERNPSGPYKQAHVQLEEAIRRVVTGENELADFPAGCLNHMARAQQKLLAAHPEALRAADDVIMGKRGAAARRGLSPTDRSVLEELCLSITDAAPHR